MFCFEPSSPSHGWSNQTSHAAAIVSISMIAAEIHEEVSMCELRCFVNGVAGALFDAELCTEIDERCSLPSYGGASPKALARVFPTRLGRMTGDFIQISATGN